MNSFAGSTFEMELAIEHLKIFEKYGTICLIYLTLGQDYYPSVFLEISDKNIDCEYYFNTLNFFAIMHKVDERKLAHIKDDFKSKINKVFKNTNLKQTKLENSLFNHLKGFYCSQKEVETLIKKRTISIEDIYIRLALIKNKEKNKTDEETQKSLTSDLCTTYETLYNPKESIKLKELFQYEKLKQRKEKRILVWGSPGIGKSTCLHHIAHEWANERLWNEFKAIFWICLCNLNTYHYPSKYESYDAYDLLSKECNIDLSTFRYLLEDEEFRSNTLLILDGYDELSYIADKGYLSDAFQQLEKIFPHILMSSRHQTVNFIPNPIEIEILGFNREDIDQYIEKFYDQMYQISEQASGKTSKFGIPS